MTEILLLSVGLLGAMIALALLLNMVSNLHRRVFRLESTLQQIRSQYQAMDGVPKSNRTAWDD